MRWRFLITLGLFGFLFLLIISKLFYWQVVKAQELSAIGQAQYGKLITVPATRGDIKTADGFPLATNTLSYLVFANPKEIKDKEHTTNVLSSQLQVPFASVSAELSQDKFWVPIASHISSNVKEQLEQKNIPGVGFEEGHTRFYPEASMAAQLLGFVGKDDQGQDKGYFGLEGYYDRQLRGREGQAIEIHDALGRPVLSKLQGDSGVQDGRSLVLHIDRTIQYIVEKKLQEGITHFGADSGMVAVMDPKTGGILAMSAFPSFDPRDFWEFDPALYKNPFITNTYEPGSTFKPLIMSTAFNDNLVKPESTCSQCGGPIKVFDYTIHTWNDQYFPNITMTDIIRHSDNTGMVYVGQLLGLDRLMDGITKFGMGDATGIDLQGEEALSLRPKNQWYPIDVATASFGQGISITPIELLDGFSAVANSGARMEPHIVSEIMTQDGQKIPILPKILSQPISSQTAKVMTEILVYTVNKGEASFARLKGYRIAGKTGTASIPVAGHYDSSQTIASFIGFAPADNPKFSMLVILDKPTASIYGAETAAPVFFDIAKDILLYYGIAPTEAE